MGSWQVRPSRAGRRPWGDDPSQGWWGEDPSFHKAIFVLARHARERLTLSDTTFSFVDVLARAAVLMGAA